MSDVSKTSDLIAEAREQAAYLRGVSRDGSMPYSGELLEQAADALEAATRVPVQGGGYTVEVDGQHFTQAQWEAVQRYCGGSQAAPGEPNDDREALIDVVKRNRSVVKRMSDGYPSVAFVTDETIADAILAAGFSRAAVPDAATERYKDAAEGNRIRLMHAQSDAERFEAERDAAVAAIERVRAVLKTEKFDVSEAALCVDNVIEVADVERAINGPTAAEKLEAEIEKHDDFYWSDDAGDLVCAECKSVLSEDDNFKCPRVAELGAGDSGE